MSGLFYECSGLTSLDLSSFNTSKLTDTYRMFSGCSSLTSLDLSSFNFSKVTYAEFMFDGCTNPNLTIYVANEDASTFIRSTSNFPSTATVVVGSMN
jgi:surface protein